MLLCRFNWTLDQSQQDLPPPGQVALEEFEQSLEIDHGPRPLGLQPVFELAQIAGLFRAMRTRLRDLAFDGGPLAVEVFELSGGLSLASSLKQGFVIMHPNRTALSFAMDTPREQRAGLTGFSLKDEGLDRPTLIILLHRKGGRRVTLRAGDGVGRQIDRKGSLGDIRIVGHGQGRNQIDLAYHKRHPRAPARP